MHPLSCPNSSHVPLPELPFTPGLEFNMPIVSDLTRTHSVPKDKWLHYQRALLSQLLQRGLNPETGATVLASSPIFCPLSKVRKSCTAHS